MIGEGAAKALLRYGAFEEGRRIALEARLREPPDVMDAVRKILRFDADMEKSGDAYMVVVHSSDLLALDSHVLDTLLLGLIEGLIAASLGRRLRGEFLERSEDGFGRLRFSPGGD